jgi:hypothetical protein
MKERSLMKNSRYLRNWKCLVPNLKELEVIGSDFKGTGSAKF